KRLRLLPPKPPAANALEGMFKRIMSTADVSTQPLSLSLSSSSGSYDGSDTTATTYTDDHRKSIPSSSVRPLISEVAIAKTASEPATSSVNYRYMLPPSDVNLPVATTRSDEEKDEDEKKEEVEDKGESGYSYRSVAAAATAGIVSLDDSDEEQDYKFDKEERALPQSSHEISYYENAEQNRDDDDDDDEEQQGDEDGEEINENEEDGDQEKYGKSLHEAVGRKWSEAWGSPVEKMMNHKSSTRTMKPLKELIQMWHRIRGSLEPLTDYHAPDNYEPPLTSTESASDGVVLVLESEDNGTKDQPGLEHSTGGHTVTIA
ncbi:hypothetical protein BX616_006338, partial [Lobosporangium transversale]